VKNSSEIVIVAPFTVVNFLPDGQEDIVIYLNITGEHCYRCLLKNPHGIQS